MSKVDRNIVEAEVQQMFDAYETTQGVVEALLIEMGWDGETIRAAQEVRKRRGWEYPKLTKFGSHAGELGTGNGVR